MANSLGRHSSLLFGMSCFPSGPTSHCIRLFGAVEVQGRQALLAPLDIGVVEAVALAPQAVYVLFIFGAGRFAPNPGGCQRAKQHENQPPAGHGMTSA